MILVFFGVECSRFNEGPVEQDSGSSWNLPDGRSMSADTTIGIVPGAGVTAGEPSQSVWVLTILGVVAASLALGVALVARQRSRARALRA